MCAGKLMGGVDSCQVRVRNLANPHCLSALEVHRDVPNELGLIIARLLMAMGVGITGCSLLISFTEIDIP